ncbi:hypothetical protein OAC51_03955 [Flavobacteriaceae bacterium]|nr:hypothetical protein [Flavobacteriaceae bacterium]
MDRIKADTAEYLLGYDNVILYLQESINKYNEENPENQFEINEALAAMIKKEKVVLDNLVTTVQETFIFAKTEKIELDNTVSIEMPRMTKVSIAQENAYQTRSRIPA